MGHRTVQEAERLLEPVAAAYNTDARWIRVRTEDYFGTLDFSGQRVLEVGAGKGLYAACVATLGAEQVIALEPELSGSSGDAIATFNQRLDRLNLPAIDFRPLTMQEFTAPPESFDMIYLLAVINHLDEQHVRRLHVSQESREIYRALMQPLYDWLKPGGLLVISDTSRTHAFTPLVNLGILKRHPFQPSIDWDIHQSPDLWQTLLEQIGFVSVDFHWATNWRYPWIPRLLTDNPLVARVYSSLFVLHAIRP